MTENASNVPAHNKISESCFGGLGFLISAKPNAHVETYQAIEMLQRNKTMDWLAEQSEQDRLFNEEGYEFFRKNEKEI